MVEKIFNHKDFTKEKLISRAIVAGVSNKRVEEEVALRKLSSLEEIKETVILLDRVEKKREHLNTIRNYANAVKSARIEPFRHEKYESNRKD